MRLFTRFSFRQSFRNRLILYLFLLGFVPLLIWAVFAYYGSVHLVQGFLEREIRAKVDEVASKLENTKNQNRILLKSLAQEIKRSPRTQWSSVLNQLKQALPEVEVAHVLDAGGVQIASADSSENFDSTLRDYFIQAKTDEPNFEVVSSEQHPQPTLCSAMLVSAEGHRLAICRRMEEILDKLQQIRVGRTGFFFVSDPQQHVLVHPILHFQNPDLPALEKEALATSKKVSAHAPPFATQSFEFEFKGNHYTGYSRELENSWTLIAFHHRAELFAWATDYLIWPICLGILAFALVAVLTGITISHLTSPLRQITFATRHFGPGNFQVRLPVLSQDELGSLASAFNEMAQRLSESFTALQEKESELEKNKADLERKVFEQSEKLLYSTKMSSLGEMAGGIAHEVNNPLAIISLRVQRLKEQVERGDLNQENLLESLEKIDITCTRINQIVKALRAFSRDGSKDPMVLENLSSIVAEAVTLCAESMKINGIELSVECPESIEIECQPVQLAQVLLNLLTNARDAVLDCPRPRISIKAQLLENEVEVRMTDNGRGIAAEVQDKIMQPFFTTKEVGAGTGLGLSISQGIVQQHHGELTLVKESSLTEFRIRLPLRQPPMATATPSNSSDR